MLLSLINICVILEALMVGVGNVYDWCKASLAAWSNTWFHRRYPVTVTFAVIFFFHILHNTMTDISTKKLEFLSNGYRIRGKFVQMFKLRVTDSMF
jgi:hypothetical protein